MTIGTNTHIAGSNASTYVAKYTAVGDYSWSKMANGTGGVHSFDLAVDSNNNVIVAGHFQSDPTFGSFSLASAGNQDVYVAKMNGSNGDFVWVAPRPCPSS